jgi:hypothetical protein
MASWGIFLCPHTTPLWPVSSPKGHHVATDKGVFIVKIGRFSITRIRKTPAGLDIYPWQALTEDRVSPELRQIVAKVARSEVKSYLEEQRENA